MTTISEKKVEEEHRKSPKGRYEIYRKHISLARGGVKDIGDWDGGHPFDGELARIPPGKRGYPMHSHAAQSEHYIILSGSGTMHGDNCEPTKISAGDHFVCLPGDAHQLENDGDDDLVYYVIADHHRSRDVTTYPNSGKRQIKPEYRYLRVEDVDSCDGEE